MRLVSPLQGLAQFSPASHREENNKGLFCFSAAGPVQGNALLPFGNGSQKIRSIENAHLQVMKIR